MTLAPVIIFPLFYLLTMGCGWYALHSGLNETIVIFLISCFCFASAFLFEHLMPRYHEWNKSKQDVKVDILHNLVNLPFSTELTRLLFLPIAFSLSQRIAPHGLWPTNLPFLVQIIFAFVVVEFFQYWLHRGLHRSNWLWRLHAVHHSAERLYFLNAGREHPLSALLMYLPNILPLVVLGANAEIIVMQSMSAVICATFQHANVDIRLGHLRYIFSVGDVHRWHHSRDTAEMNHNYGLNWAVWDLIFGTYYFPGSPPPVKTGISDMPAFPQTYRKQLTAMFHWKHYVKH